MFFATGMAANGRPYRTPLQLSGLAAADPAVIAMQQALQALSQKAMNPMFSPGPATGEVTPQTMSAIVAALDLLVAQLPDVVAAGLKAGLASGAQSADVKTFVGQYAAIIAEAATVATAALPTPNPISTFAYDVKQSPWAVLIVIGLGLIGYRLFSKPTVKNGQGASV